MTMTVTESAAAVDLADWIAGSRRWGDGKPVTSAEAVEALDVLLKSAGKRLQMTYDGRAAQAVGRRDAISVAEESDGDAQAVCRALADHVAHGGSIPWPIVSRAFAGWVEAKAVPA